MRAPGATNAGVCGAFASCLLFLAACAGNGGSSVTPTPSPSASPTATRSLAASATGTSAPTSSPTPTATMLPTTPPATNCAIPGVICTVAGTGMAQYDGDGRPALDTSLYFPIDLAFDRAGRLLILDWNNLRLRRVNDDGTIATIMGTDIEDFPTDGALAVDTPLHHASDIEFDFVGNLYVAGDHAPIVFRVGLDDRVFTVAGMREPGYAGDGGPALAALLDTPFGVLPDAHGGFYVSDLAAHVVRYVDTGGIITTVAGTGERGYSGDGGPGTAAQLAGPARLKLGPDGALYFCETKNHVIRRLHPDGTIDTVAGTGEGGYAGDGGPAVLARFDTPYDLRFAPNGDLYVADSGNDVIRRIDAAGIVTTVVGSGTAAFAGDGGPARACALRRPSALIFDAAGSLWIADTSNQRVRRVWQFLAEGDAAAPPRSGRDPERRRCPPRSEICVAPVCGAVVPATVVGKGGAACCRDATWLENWQPVRPRSVRSEWRGPVWRRCAPRQPAPGRGRLARRVRLACRSSARVRRRP